MASNNVADKLRKISDGIVAYKTRTLSMVDSTPLYKYVATLGTTTSGEARHWVVKLLVNNEADAIIEQLIVSEPRGGAYGIIQGLSMDNQLEIHIYQGPDSTQKIMVYSTVEILGHTSTYTTITPVD